jgi:hypothetical protein
MIIRNVTYVDELKTGDLVFAQGVPRIMRFILSYREFNNEVYITHLFLFNFEVTSVRLKLKDTFLDKTMIIRKD